MPENTNHTNSQTFQTFTQLENYHWLLAKQLPLENVDDPDSPFVQDVMRFLHVARSTGDRIEREMDRWHAQSYINLWFSLLYRVLSSRPDFIMDDFLLAPFDVALLEKKPDDRKPYPGSRPFSEQDSELYFGRSAEIAKAQKLLETSGYVIIVGAVGSGKTSLLRAGLLPWLKAEFGNRIIGPIEPGDTFVAVKNVVLLIDPADDLYSRCEERERKQFIVTLRNAVKNGARIVIAVSTAFVHSLLTDVELSDNPDRVIVLDSLSSDSVRDSVLRPAEIVGLYVSEKIVPDLVRATWNDPSGASYLAFALDHAWQASHNDNRNSLSIDDIAGFIFPSGALRRVAETVLEPTRRDNQEKKSSTNSIVAAQLMSQLLKARSIPTVNASVGDDLPELTFDDLKRAMARIDPILWQTALRQLCDIGLVRETPSMSRRSIESGREWDTRYRIVHPTLVSLGYLRNLASLAEVEQKLQQVRRTAFLFVITSTVFVIGFFCIVWGMILSSKAGNSLAPYYFWVIGGIFIICGAVFWSIALIRVLWPLLRQARYWHPHIWSFTNKTTSGPNNK